MMRAALPALLAAVLLTSAPSLAESGSWVNLHLEPALGFRLGGEGDPGMGRSLALKLDVPIFEGLSGQVMGEVVRFRENEAFLRPGTQSGLGLGLRYRIWDDREGYRFHLGPNPQGHSGNWLGNLWVDANAVFLRGAGKLRPALDVGVGLESSLVDGIQVGPFFRVVYLGPEVVGLLGLSVSLGVPDTSVHDRDRDGDGIPDHVDACPDEAEDVDGFEDADGCPDPDNDQDGILDADDRCPDQPGPVENQGCPDGDRDRDGIVDRLDRCPDAPEDVDGFEDEDGCPDPDNDADGVPDIVDRCPDQPGPAENQGCPDTDRDGDGIVDRLDKCPDEPETFNGIDDEDGCPEKEARVYVEHQQVVITDKVFFEFNKARILPRSHALLDSVAQVLVRFPQIEELRVDGHTDDVGNEAYNQKLSEERARAVRDYLVARGISAERLGFRGFGKSRPLAEAKDNASRERNRRVEFTITRPEGGIVPVEMMEPPDGGPPVEVGPKAK